MWFQVCQVYWLSCPLSNLWTEQSLRTMWHICCMWCAPDMCVICDCTMAMQAYMLETVHGAVRILWKKIRICAIQCHYCYISVCNEWTFHTSLTHSCPHFIFYWKFHGPCLCNHVINIMMFLLHCYGLAFTWLITYFTLDATYILLKSSI